MDHEDGDGDGAGLDGGVDGDSGGGMEEPSGGDSGGVSPLRSSPAAAFCLSVSWFSVSPPPPFAKRQGTFFIGVFRSRRSRWTKDRRPRSSEGERAGPTWPGILGRVGPSHFQPVGLLVFNLIPLRSSRKF